MAESKSELERLQERKAELSDRMAEVRDSVFKGARPSDLSEAKYSVVHAMNADDQEEIIIVNTRIDELRRSGS